MHASLRNSHHQSGNLGRSCTLIKFIQDTYLLRRRQTVTLPAVIVRARKKARIWILDSSGKLLTKLVHTELEALVFTCLGNLSYIPGSLTLSPISKDEINITISCLPRMGQGLTQISMSLCAPRLTKFFGHGEQKYDLKQSPY